MFYLFEVEVERFIPGGEELGTEAMTVRAADMDGAVAEALRAAKSIEVRPDVECDWVSVTHIK